MKSSKQLSLFNDPRKGTKLWWIRKKQVYGGSINYRKVSRPFDSKQLIHAVLKGRPGSALRFTKSVKSIQGLLFKIASRNGVRLVDFAINHDHIHLMLSARSAEKFRHFLRHFSSEMGKQYKRLRKKFGIESGAGLWIHRPFTRLLSWGKKSRLVVRNYFNKNRLEAFGFIEYTARKSALCGFLEKWDRQLKLSTA